MNFCIKTKDETPAQLLSDFRQWAYDMEIKDWVDSETGELLANFTPTASLEFLLKEQINLHCN